MRFSDAEFTRHVMSVTKIVAAAAALAAMAAGGTPVASAATHNWIAIGWNIHLANQIDPATTAHFFNTADSFGTGPNPGSNPVTDGFLTTAVLVYDSYAQFASDLRNGVISYRYKWVFYDPEMWPQTPHAEQLDPVKYLHQFGQLAHAHGYKVIEAPARDLGRVTDSACPLARGEKLDHWYIRCGIARAAAANADVYLVQDQANTTNLTAYDWLFTSARGQARAANPKIVVDCEVSTNRGTPWQMATAAKSVAANGYYIASTKAALADAVRFLRQMRAAGY